MAMRYEHNPNLSLKAKGIMRVIEVNNDEKEGVVNFSLDALDTKSGRDSKRKAINELIAAGYMKSEKIRNELGQVKGVRYHARYSKGE